MVTHKLPNGDRLILVADTTPITDVRRELRVVMLVAGIVTLILTALLLSAAVRGTLRPLDRLTALAGRITSGDRGRRLRPDRADTELGRAATAFDGVLDALEAPRPSSPSPTPAPGCPTTNGNGSFTAWSGSPTPGTVTPAAPGSDYTHRAGPIPRTPRRPHLPPRRTRRGLPTHPAHHAVGTDRT